MKSLPKHPQANLHPDGVFTLDCCLFVATKRIGSRAQFTLKVSNEHRFAECGGK